MPNVYIYVVDRDFGFAPNPFHGFCTLATCKPGIREGARVGDWVIGMGGARLEATGRCIFAMRVTSQTDFNDYWSNPRYLAKRPVRNGSRKMLVGDNVYHCDAAKKWHQADSHHSKPDGTVNFENLATDTKSIHVLISDYFFYFGRCAPVVPVAILRAIGYSNCRNYRVFSLERCSRLINWIETTHRTSLNQVSGRPYDFDNSNKRYSGRGSRII